uniref:Stabilin 2 n=1 Tax=Cairina moschata TaxID=8855 RepID=A0A8C3C9B0_CAIMO
MNLFPLQMKKQCDQKLLIRMKTECVPCSLNLETQCPAGYTKITNGTGIPDCRYYLEIKTHTLSFPGCRHACMKEFEQPECCQGHWGPDCMGKCCFQATNCLSVYLYTDEKLKFLFPFCNSQKGFGGTACEKCAEENLFGPQCTSVCNCVHGVCNSGITGDGRCTCLSGYQGLSCDQPIAECEALRCPANSRCTISDEDGRRLQCTCLPNYHGDGTHCEPINPCSKKVCDPNANCIYLGPNHHKCACQEGYKGDGQVCLPIDPCQAIYGNCPAQSTICIYDGPGKSHCECKEHYENFVPGKGCSMIDICETNNTCHKKAKCSMVAPGQITCTCQRGFVGNGFVCYGSIMERLQDLNTEVGGRWQGKLTSALSLMENVYEWPLSNLGPFTVLVPTNRGLKGINIKDLLSNKLKAQYFVKLHIIAGQLDTSSLNNTDVIYTLTGKSGEISRGEKDNQLRIRIQGGKRKGKLLQGDIIASNGILHIVDKSMDNIEPTFESNKEETIMSVLQDNGKYSQFTTLIEKTGLGMDLQQENRPYTVFVPSNGALNNMKTEAMDYLLSAENNDVTFILINLYSFQLEAASLISIEHIRSMAKQFLHFNRTSTGQVLVSGEKMEETDIVAKNGRIHTLAGVLIPPTIIPILPHWCDETRSQITVVRELQKNKQHQKINSPTFPKTGCARYCNIITKEPKCCRGFFGPNCSPCPGGFSKPCSGNGQCMDGLDGNGTCTCAEAFQGSRCQFCSDPGKYGPQCDKKCLCIYGKCDNRIDSDGICLPGSCRSGYTGKLCDKPVVPCEPSLRLCHAHADCHNLHLININEDAECIQMGPGEYLCACQAGWTGDGQDCSAINNCLLPSVAGCHENATCVYIGPGQNDCKCKDGFRGNGIECTPINSCLEQNGKCHHLATCQFEPSHGWECVCPKGYEGDGRTCYGNMNYFTCSAFMQEAEINSVLSTTSNLTILVPSPQAIENMDEDEKAFWMSKSNIPTLLKYHVLTGAYSFADFQNLSSSDMLPTSLQSNFLHLIFSIASAPCSCNHSTCTCIDGIYLPFFQVLTPLRSTVMPRLLARLEQMPDYSIFRDYIIQYGLANEIEAANSYTVFAPNNDAIENYLSEKNISTLQAIYTAFYFTHYLSCYHITTKHLCCFLIAFLLQLFINDAPLNYANVATDKGIIHGLGKVLEIKKNRCDINDTVITVSGSCRICSQPTSCPPGTKEIVRAGVLSALMLPLSMAFLCLQTRECCAGFFGPQCQPCPGKAGSACFGNGVCMDGINGTGTCQCGAGFVGTACESCAEGKYGRNCDQVCACVHGKCSSGINGDGSCECDVGWRGVTCESGEPDFFFLMSSASFHVSSCLLLSNGTAYCKCAAGFTGNGTFCTAIDACETSNGGCSDKAECRKTTPGNRVCVCNAGYTGDGVVCIEINPCLENNGGCDRNAECTQTGPNQVSTLSAQINKTGQLLTVGGGVGEYSHLNFVFKWKTGFHTKNSEKCVRIYLGTMQKTDQESEASSCLPLVQGQEGQ